jgi:hypothetical protein
MLGEIHSNKQEYEWLDALVANPQFADRVDDIVMEFGNSLSEVGGPIHRGRSSFDRGCAAGMAKHTGVGASATNLWRLV